MLINFKEACKELGIKPSTLYQWSETGLVPVVRVGKLLKYNKDKLLRYFESGEFARVRERRHQGIK